MDENLNGFLHGTKWIMFHGVPELPTQGGGFNVKP